MIACLTLIVTGLSILFMIASLEMDHLQQSPWNSAFILLDRSHIPSDMEYRTVWVRLVEREEMLDSDILLEIMGEMVRWERFADYVRLSDPELVIALDLAPEELEPLLESGRLPRPGTTEALAGDLARDEEFQIDGITFQVVGRLKRSVSGFLFAYMLPHASGFAPLFAPEWGAVEGYLLIHGDRLVLDGLLPDYYPELPDVSEETMKAEESDIYEEESPFTAAPVLPNYLGGVTRSPDWMTRVVLLGMLLLALGGAWLIYDIVIRLYQSGSVLLKPFALEVLSRPKLFWMMHLFFYGLFFYAMGTALENPLLAYRMKQYIEAVFYQGGLSHVGAAYDSGSVSAAAWMTFYNNYIEQTLGLTFLISLFPVPLGLVKNVLSFLLVGGAMSPMWSGSAQLLVVHAITMALELESYILACFAITAWPLKLLSGLRSGQCVSSIKSGLLMLLSAIFLTGVILAIAAIYEAFTLIHVV